jgi:hypothetical protein
MSTVQISPNSLLMNAADVNPLAHPAYQNPLHKTKELNNKTIEQIKTDTVTISEEALAKSLEPFSSAGASDKKAADEVKVSSTVAQSQSQAKTEVTSKNDTAPSVDQVTISKEASLKSALLQSIEEAANVITLESAYEKLGL